MESSPDLPPFMLSPLDIFIPFRDSSIRKFQFTFSFSFVLNIFHNYQLLF